MEGRKEVHDSSFLYHSKWEIMYFGKNVFGLTSLVFQDFQCNRNKRIAESTPQLTMQRNNIIGITFRTFCFPVEE